MEVSQVQKKAALHIVNDMVEKLRDVFADHKDYVDSLVLTSLLQAVTAMMYLTIDLDKLDLFLCEFSKMIKNKLTEIDKAVRKEKP